MNKETEKKLLSIVQKNYEEIANDFSKSRKKPLWPELIELSKQVKNKDKVLDVGCGNGRLLEAFLGKDVYYVGIDKSVNLIKLAKKDYESENVKFLTGDILNLGDFPEYDFDYVFCIAVLHHLPGKNLQSRALRQLKNKIKKNGKIILTVWNLWSQEKYEKLIYKFFFLRLIGKNKMDFGDILFDWKNSNGENVSQRYYHAFTKRSLKKIIKKAGLKIDKIYKDKFNYYCILGK